MPARGWGLSPGRFRRLATREQRVKPVRAVITAAGFNDQPQVITQGPLAGLSLSRNKVDGFTETGAGALNLRVAGQTINSSKSMLGAKASFDTGRIRFEPRVIWAHEFGDLNTPMMAQFQGAATASPFQVSGAGLKRDTLILGLGATGSISKGMNLFADVQAVHNLSQRNLAVLMGLRMRWQAKHRHQEARVRLHQTRQHDVLAD